MYINKVRVEHYTYPWKNGKRGSELKLENTLEINDGNNLKRLLPLLDEFEDSTSLHAGTITEVLIKIKEDK